MEFDRSKAKGAIKQTDQNDSELLSTFSDAHKAQAEIAKIKNKHELDKIKAERGLIGWLFGN